MERGATRCRSPYVATCGMMTFSAAIFDTQFSIPRKDPGPSRWSLMFWLTFLHLHLRPPAAPYTAILLCD